jgi:hypothetical protein
MFHSGHAGCASRDSKAAAAAGAFREVRENGMGRIGHGVISKQIMGLRILVPFAGPLRRTVPAYFQTASQRYSFDPVPASTP